MNYQRFIPPITYKPGPNEMIAQWMDGYTPQCRIADAFLIELMGLGVRGIPIWTCDRAHTFQAR